MKKEKICLSTMASDAVRVAREYGVNMEIAEYCAAWDMDEKFAGVDGVAKKKQEGIPGCTLHAPYNERFPCAADRGEYLYHHPLRCDCVHYGIPVPQRRKESLSVAT